MGYCYTIVGGARLLVCDNCDAHGGVCKVACKYGYCPANALCAACRKDPALKARVADYCETNCKAASERMAAVAAAEAAALKAGELIFCSALGMTIDGVYGVELTFKGSGVERVDRLVGKGMYDTVMEKKYGGSGVVTLSEVETLIATGVS